MFKKAEKKQSKLRLALEGPSGAGKTYSGLILASSLSDKIAVIDTEHGSASLYADKFGFDVLELKPPYTPEAYSDALRAAAEAGYGVCLIDSLSHEWNGDGGCLSIVDGLGKGFAGWKTVTPRHERLINTILNSPMHIIATMRSKAEYSIEQDIKGRATPKKIGMAPIQRDSVEYEFTVVFTLNQAHFASVSKDRTSLFDGKDFPITKDTGKVMLDWLNGGVASKPVKQEEKPVEVNEELPSATEEEQDSDYETVSGELEKIHEKDENGRPKFGLKIKGDKKIYVTYSPIVADAVKPMIGDTITINYNVVMVDGKAQYEVMGFDKN